jgi:hypothetical protein
MKRVLPLFVFLAFIFTTSCEWFKDDDPPKQFVPDESDAAGNILIINNSNERLVLYKDEQIVKKIPASSTDFLVNIPNPNEGTVELALYRWEDVKDDINNPNPDEVYKKWLVPLSKSDNIEERVTWHLSGASQYTTTATINFSYYGGTDEFVDIYLNNRTGAKIMTMAPGQQYKKVGLDYGNYTLHYLYWFSDQNNTEAFEELDWIENEMINGEEKDIWLILNENRKDVTMIVPHLNATKGKGMQYGNLKISNKSGDPVQIYVGDKLIESLCYLDDGSVKNLSTIDRNGTYTFVMPIYDPESSTEEITLTAKHLTNALVVEETTLDIQADSTVTWTVDGLPDE